CSRHQRDVQFPRPVVHPFGIRPGWTQVLIAEDRHHASILSERVGDLFKESPTRIEDLSDVAGGIVSVLADADDTIDRDVVATHCHRPFDGIEDRHVKFFRKYALAKAAARTFDAG